MTWGYDHPRWGLEFDWLAVDSAGRVAQFSTTGRGPTPEVVLDDWNRADEAVGQVLALPATGECIVYPTGLGRFDDWIDVSRRGLFTYVWSAESGPYLRWTVPEHPVQVESLPRSVKESALLVDLSLSFSALDEIDLEDLGIRQLPTSWDRARRESGTPPGLK